MKNLLKKPLNSPLKESYLDNKLSPNAPFPYGTLSKEAPDKLFISLKPYTLLEIYTLWMDKISLLKEDLISNKDSNKMLLLTD